MPAAALVGFPFRALLLFEEVNEAADFSLKDIRMERFDEEVYRAKTIPLLEFLLAVLRRS
jgi:hypothetical protein